MSAEPTLVLPERAAGRPEARHFVSSLRGSLAGITVHVDASGMAASAPSFLDELVKQILVDRGAAKLVLFNVTNRPAGFATSAAQRRSVEDRLTVKLKTA